MVRISPNCHPRPSCRAFAARLSGLSFGKSFASLPTDINMILIALQKFIYDCPMFLVLNNFLTLDG